MTTYLVPVWREVINTQSRTLEIQADDEHAAATIARGMALADDMFWDGVDEEPVESRCAQIDHDNITEGL